MVGRLIVRSHFSVRILCEEVARARERCVDMERFKRPIRPLDNSAAPQPLSFAGIGRRHKTRRQDYLAAMQKPLITHLAATPSVELLRYSTPACAALLCKSSPKHS